MGMEGRLRRWREWRRKKMEKERKKIWGNVWQFGGSRKNEKWEDPRVGCRPVRVNPWRGKNGGKLSKKKWDGPSPSWGWAKRGEMWDSERNGLDNRMKDLEGSGMKTWVGNVVMGTTWAWWMGCGGASEIMVVTWLDGGWWVMVNVYGFHAHKKWWKIY